MLLFMKNILSEYIKLAFQRAQSKTSKNNFKSFQKLILFKKEYTAIDLSIFIYQQSNGEKKKRKIYYNLFIREI